MADYIVNRWLYFFFTNLFKCSALPHGAILPHLPLPPPIIVRFLKRDTQNKFYGNKSKFNAVSNFGITGMNDLFINENLTSKRSEFLAKTILKAKYEANPWTKNGDIFVRKFDQAQSLNIKSMQDIAKIN